jgi:hypothetical protein
MLRDQIRVAAPKSVEAQADGSPFHKSCGLLLSVFGVEISGGTNDRASLGASGIVSIPQKQETHPTHLTKCS